eukprot:scaffold284983_cov34-Tisochrysis_lutea.AAC.4
MMRRCDGRQRTGTGHGVDTGNGRKTAARRGNHARTPRAEYWRVTDRATGDGGARSRRSDGGVRSRRSDGGVRWGHEVHIGIGARSLVADGGRDALATTFNPQLPRPDRARA